MTAVAAQRPVGELLREWRERRRLSQLELALQADVSTRHLSFLETGRSRPTRAMILRLADHLDVPLRERNDLLLAGGFAPAYPHRALAAPELAQVRAALRLVLTGHEPYPALVMDRWWNLLDANSAVSLLVEGCAPHLLEPPVNVLRLSLHPDGIAARIVNLTQWRAHLIGQLRRRTEQTGDAALAALLDEMSGYPVDDAAGAAGAARASATDVVLPMRLRHGDGELSFFSVAATVDTAADITVAELVIESFYPADEATARALRG